ncbi:MAG: Eco57I restriction-modification methylase domain-containing protein, partial [Anaerolineae bacterium]
YGLTESDLASVTIGDFVLQPPQAKFSAIVANPPYIRHHRISQESKEQLKRLGVLTTGKTLDGRAGLHVYFLIRALSLLEQDGRLAFIMPADTCEGKFARDLWRWISTSFALDAVVTFAPAASPFPGVDTNPLIFFLRKAKPRATFLWARCCESKTETLKTWVGSNFAITPGKALVVTERNLSEGLATGLSRPPAVNQTGLYVLGDFVHVMRGIATGANEFFFMTDEQAQKTGIPGEYFIRAVGRTRDVPTDEITQMTIESLRALGRPTLLLTLAGDPHEAFPETIRNFLREGEAMGLPQRPLISQRKPWYRMETRAAPPFLFAYLGRRHSRFIRNTAKIIPLTGFLCVYPKSSDPDYLKRLWGILSHPDTIANLAIVGKSYGDGSIKVEPRSLERLPIPDHVITQFGLPSQMRLFEQQESYGTGSLPDHSPF